MLKTISKLKDFIDLQIHLRGFALNQKQLNRYVSSLLQRNILFEQIADIIEYDTDEQILKISGAKQYDE